MWFNFCYIEEISEKNYIFMIDFEWIFTLCYLLCHFFQSSCKIALRTIATLKNWQHCPMCADGPARRLVLLSIVFVKSVFKSVPRSTFGSSNEQRQVQLTESGFKYLLLALLTDLRYDNAVFLDDHTSFLRNAFAFGMMSFGFEIYASSTVII